MTLTSPCASLGAAREGHAPLELALAILLEESHPCQMELSGEHFDLLQAIDDLQAGDHDRYPATSEVGQRLLEIYKQRGGSYSWHASPPWHGTSPWAQELEAAGLIDRDVGMASFHAPGTPTPTADDYYLGLTAAGRARLEEHSNDSG